MNKPLNRLRHHVTGAIERGEAVAIVERTVGNSDPVAEMMAEHRKVLAERDELVAAHESVIEWTGDDHDMPNDASARLEWYARRLLMIRNCSRAALAKVK